MKIDFDAVLKLRDGKPIPDETGKPTPLSVVVVQALDANLESDRTMAGADKVRLGKLANLAYGGGSVELTPEDLSLIRDRVGKCYGPLIVLQVYEMTGGA